MRFIVASIAVFLLSCGSQAESELKPGDVFKDCDVCPEMVVLPTGSFMMGVHPSQARWYLPPWRRETVSRSIAVGKFEVLVPEFEACVDAGGCQSLGKKSGPKLDHLPAYNLSWNNANDFVDWLADKTGKNYRLLNEKEWEFAAKAGTETRFWWGDEFQHGRAVCQQGCFPEGDLVQGSYIFGGRTVNFSYYAGSILNPLGGAKIVPPNSFGLFFMQANVREWVSDCHRWNGKPELQYTETPKTEQCDKRLLKGDDIYAVPEKLSTGRHIGAAISQRGFPAILTGTRVAVELP